MKSRRPPTEIPLKQWLHEQAAQHSLSPHGIYMRLHRGKYPKVKLRHLSARVVRVIL